MLVVAAGLMSRSYVRLLDTDPGFDATSVLTLRVDLPSGAYRDLERVSDFHAEILDRLEGLPGVSAVAATARFRGVSLESCNRSRMEGAASLAFSFMPARAAMAP